MERHQKFFAFKYKLGILLFVVVFLVSSFLGFFQYINMKRSLERSLDQSKKLVRERVVNIVHDTDYINSLIEKPLEQEAKEILQAVALKYESEGTIDFELEPFLKDNKSINLYIIDTRNTIIAATDQGDLGLNFAPWPDFTNYLDQVRREKTFATSRMSLSLKESEMTKYCYLPSKDGKYIFETGSLLEQKDQLSNEIGFGNFEEHVVRDNAFVESVILYDYEGTSYKENNRGENLQVDSEHFHYFKKAIETMEIVEMVKNVNGKTLHYQYIPYQIVGAQGANERNVIEIVYNNSIMEKNLQVNIIIISMVVFLGAIVSASLGLYKARSIIKPIEVITEGVAKVAAGNFDFALHVESNDEFSILGKQFSEMTKQIKRLLEERYRIQQDLERKNEEIHKQNEEISSLFEETTALNEELESLLQRNEDSYFETVRALANAIEEKDAYTGGHCERVMRYSLMIATEMGLSRHQVNDLKFGSILHDIGKIGLSESILNKEGALTELEYFKIKMHPKAGNRILENLRFLENCRKIVYEHHERVDGKGYPNGLKGDQIDLLAKIVCVADAFDAMTSSRPYRKNAMTTEEAIQELRSCSGSQFDELVVDAFIRGLIKK